ncbi:unnamed protein product, partial [Natator depressus]
DPDVEDPGAESAAGAERGARPGAAGEGEREGGAGWAAGRPKHPATGIRQSQQPPPRATAGAGPGEGEAAAGARRGQEERRQAEVHVGRDGGGDAAGEGAAPGGAGGAAGAAGEGGAGRPGALRAGAARAARGEERHEEELRGQLKEEKARSRELESSRQTVEELRLQIQSMDGAKGWFERRLKEAEELIEKHQRDHEEALRVCKEQHGAELKLKAQEVEAAREQLRVAESSRDEHMATISQLRQEVKDTVDGQRILEKKGSATLKDLKRQLQLERKRADKLQERLQEILTNSKTRTGIEELVLAEMSSPSRVQTGDSSSISSFSYREIMKEGSGPGSTKSNTGSPQSQRPADLSDEEISELFQRLAEMQQEKWMLEEKVKHLEVSSASMAEDLCRKSAIIETYVMDSRIDVSAAHGPLDRSTLGSVLRDLVKPGDENLREMNKKLQNLLEEQLTKNMHLQKHLEVLSQEIVRLSKECVPLPPPAPNGADPGGAC